MANTHKKYADRGLVSKFIRDVEAQIRMLQDFTFKGNSRSQKNRSASGESHGERVPNAIDNDVILATKPLGGWSCGSCGTMINNLPSMPTGDYNISGRLPNKKLGVAASQKLSVKAPAHKISTSVDTHDLLAI